MDTAVKLLRNTNLLNLIFGRKHKNNERQSVSCDGFEDMHDDRGGYSGEIDDDLEDDDELETGQDSIETLTRFIALFILKTKEENQLNQKIMDSILHNTEDLVEQSLEALKSRVKSCIDITNIEGLSDVLEQPSTFSQAVRPLSNQYLQVKYFVEHFNFVVSKILQ